MISKKFYESTMYSFNSFFLSVVTKYSLSLNEFLVLVYFLNNINKQFNPEKISNDLSISIEDVLESFNSLSEKSLVTLEAERSSDGIINEVISLKNIFDEIDKAAHSSDVSELDRVVEKYKSVKKSELDEIEKEMINAWRSTNISDDDIIKAIDDANYNGVFSLRYIDKILMENKPNSSDDNNELFDYDWLGE